MTTFAARSVRIAKIRIGISGLRAIARLDRDEGGEQREPEADRDQDAGGAPAEHVGAHDPVDERGQPGRDVTAPATS